MEAMKLGDGHRYHVLEIAGCCDRLFPVTEPERIICASR